VPSTKRQPAESSKSKVGDRPVTRSGHVLDVPGPRKSNESNGNARTSGRASAAANGKATKQWWDAVHPGDAGANDRMAMAAAFHRAGDQLWSPEVGDTRARSRLQDERLYEQGAKPPPRSSAARQASNGNVTRSTRRAQPAKAVKTPPVKPAQRQTRARGGK
jgi:hypothetical protein